MTEQDEFDRFLPDDTVDTDNLSVEIPAEQPLQPERIASSFDPMGEIQLRGQAYRGLAGGQTPWWILISGWAIFGALVGVIAHAAINSSSLTLWILLIIVAIPLLILWRGTSAKLASRRRN